MGGYKNKKKPDSLQCLRVQARLIKRREVGLDRQVSLMEIKSREVGLDPQVSLVEIKSREVVLDRQVSLVEIKSREVELGSESWTSFASVVSQQRSYGY